MFVRSPAPRLLAQSCGKLTRTFSSTSSLQADFTHVVIGGGVVGLATARALATREGTSTLLLERHGQVGTEISARNSEVIHAGLYYGAGTLKQKLCISGKELMYAFCAKYAVPHRNTGKWLVAQDDAQREGLERVHTLCRDELGVPTAWVSASEAQRLEPHVRAAAGVLDSPSTGIVDIHTLMTTLQGLFEDDGGETSLSSAVTTIEPLAGSGLPGSGGWRLTVRDPSSGEESEIETETLVNCAGLGAVDIHNMIVPSERQRRLYYAKGNYFSYAASHPKVSRLIYPAPVPGLGGLGTHLTLDMGGRVRFGPDVEWVDSPDNLTVNAERMPQAIEEIRKYLPSIDVAALVPDYVGIRPKLTAQSAGTHGKGFQDFYIEREEGFEGWVNLLGIESPGLTSSLAIGDMVKGLLYGNAK